jgi:NTP pyrophosphatase (non-canonical NTP hydrolase)
MELKDLVIKCHNYALEKGFWENDKRLATMDGVLMTVNGVDETLNTRNYIINQKMLLVISELIEAMEALRNNKSTGVINILKNNFEEEIADTFIRLFDLCGYLEIDIEKHIALKMAVNKLRPYKHDKEF